MSHRLSRMGLLETRFGYSKTDGYPSKAITLSDNEAKIALLAMGIMRAKSCSTDAAKQVLDSLNKKRRLGLTNSAVRKISSFIIGESSGFSFLGQLLCDASVEDLNVREGENVRAYLRKQGWVDCDVIPTSAQKLVDLANRMARPIGRRRTPKDPSINATLPFGRLHAVMPPVSDRVELSIRRFNAEPFSPAELVDLGSVSAEAMAFLWMCVQCDSNILICGNTGSGKT